MTASAGALTLEKTLYTANMIYGSGLRAGFVNQDHVPAYATFNLGAAHELQLAPAKAAYVRFDVVNLFDRKYELRDGSASASSLRNMARGAILRRTVAEAVNVRAASC